MGCDSDTTAWWSAPGDPVRGEAHGCTWEPVTRIRVVCHEAGCEWDMVLTRYETLTPSEIADIHRARNHPQPVVGRRATGDTA